MNSSHPARCGRRGASIVELSIVILVILALVAVLFIGANGWRNGSDRATCILTQRNMQQAVRAYQNLYGYRPGGHPYAENGSQDIALHLFTKGYIEHDLYERSQGARRCPSGGIYSVAIADRFPPLGVLFMTCSLAASRQHAPEIDEEW